MKTLFIDFYKTLCHDQYWRSLTPAENSAVQDFLFSGKNSLVTDWMRGAYNAEEINKLVADETGIDYNYLWNVFVKDCTTMHIEQELLELLHTLRNDFHVVVITENMDSFDRFTVPSVKLDTYVDKIVNSFNEKCLKTDDAGKLFLQHVTGNITDAVLIDDSENSCTLFESLGGTAYRVQDNTDVMRFLRDCV